MSEMRAPPSEGLYRSKPDGGDPEERLYREALRQV